MKPGNIMTLFGSSGVCATDGERMQCHECGRWYRNVGIHAFNAHGLPAEDYREKFGLRYTQPLASEDLSKRLSASMKKVMDVDRLASIRPLEVKGASRPRRLQSKLDPRYIEARKNSVAAMRQGYREALAKGLKPSAAHLHTAEVRAKAEETKKPRMHEIAQKISAALKKRYAEHGVPPKPPITEATRERLRSAAKKRGISPETRKKMADTKRTARK